MPQKPDKFLPAMYGGIIMGLLSSIPVVSMVNCLCCAGVLLGGFLSVYFYNKGLTPEMDALTSSDGMALGFFAGLFGAVVTIILSGLFYIMWGDVSSRVMFQMMDSAGILDRMPPEARAQMEQSEQGFSVVTIVASLVMCTLFGFLGGLIGYAVFRKKGGPEGKQQQLA